MVRVRLDELDGGWRGSVSFRGTDQVEGERRLLVFGRHCGLAFGGISRVLFLSLRFPSSSSWVHCARRSTAEQGRDLSIAFCERVIKRMKRSCSYMT